MIKNLIYLDEYKMYSMSSQIFEGVTEYLVSENGSSTEKTEEQRGPVGSGRLLADILKSTNRVSEKKYLHDYSYTLFEKHLIESSKVLIIDEDSVSASIGSIPDFSFVKIKAKALFNDVKAIKDILENFNEIGSSLAMAQDFEGFSEFRRQIQQIPGKQKPVKRSKAKGFGHESLNAGIISQENDEARLKFAETKGLYQDPDRLESLRSLLNYGFHDKLELQLKILEFIFSADLNRDILRESEDSIIRKYSRRTEKEFIVFGIITQSSVEEPESPENDDEAESIKIAVLNLANRLTDFEMTFSRKSKNEIIVDPIAVYTEL